MQPRNRQTVVVTVGDTTYSIRQMGARQGRRVWFKLVSALSGGLKEIRHGVESMADAGLNDLGSAIQGALNGLGEEDFDSVCQTLAEHTAVVFGSRQVELSVMFDDHFAGHYLEMTKWLVEALKANFADFFTEFKMKIATASPGDPSPAETAKAQ